MNPATLTAATFKVTGPGVTPVAGGVAYVGTTATFSPTVNFANNTLYTATITTGAKDLAGNALASNFVFTFTTGLAADTTAPTVSVTSPTNTAVAVPLNRKVSIGFSEAMDPLTINTTTFTLTGPGVTPVTGTVSAVGTLAVFTPTSNLLPSTTYTATIKGGVGGVADMAANVMASNFVITFTTSSAADTTAPTVSVTSPTNTAVAVPINRKVSIGFSEAMDPLTIKTATFTLTGPGVTPVTGTVSAVGTSAIFTPASNLLPITTYTATIKGGVGGVADLAANVMASNFVFTFTTGLAPDTTAPMVVSTINANGATGVAVNTKVGATFSEPMNPLTLTSANFTFTTGGVAVPGTVTYSGVNVVLTPTSNLAFSTTYTATIKGGIGGAEDAAGNVMAANYTWSWTTGVAPDAIAPTVILVNPADLATGVALNSSVNATFSEAMDPLTVSTATFTLQTTAGPGPVLAGLVNYDAISMIATLAPSSNLTPSTNYTATIKGGIGGAADLADNVLALDKVWSFTTGTGLAPGAVPLISAGTFGLMATSAITCVPACTINGDVSLEPGTSITGPPVVNGATHINDTVSAQARLDLLAAYNFAKALPAGTTIAAGADLGALYPGPAGIPPGTYTSGSTMLVSTPLLLNAGGNADAVWVFQIGSSLTTGADVTLTGGAQAKNVFWVPTSDATIGVGTIFHGTIVSGRDVTAVTGSTINGRILAGAITAGTIALQAGTTVNVPAP